MRLNEFWIVSRPSEHSTAEDICTQVPCEKNLNTMEHLIKGGVSGSDVIAVYTAMPEAMEHADRVIAAYQQYLAASRSPNPGGESGESESVE